jgi:hypothetical protein
VLAAGLPADPMQWSVGDVAEWLNMKGFSQYAPTFKVRSINGYVLPLSRQSPSNYLCVLHVCVCVCVRSCVTCGVCLAQPTGLSLSFFAFFVLRSSFFFFRFLSCLCVVTVYAVDLLLGPSGSNINLGTTAVVS